MSFQIVKLSHISKSFGAKLVLEDISLTISEGDRFFLVGENGSGKTTLAKILSQDEEPDSGQLEQRKNLQIAFLPQETNVCQELSRGQERRLILEALFLQEPELLILDEPTNHLDDDNIQWLEEALLRYRGACFIISHDRTFINNSATHIVELSGQSHKLAHFGGNYDFYLKERKNQLQIALKAYEEQKEEKKRLKAFIKEKTFSKPRIRTCKDKNKMSYDKRGERFVQSQSKIVRQAHQRLDEIEDNPLTHPLPKANIGWHFCPQELRCEAAITLEGICKSFDKQQLLDNVDLVISSRERLIITGANGSGKTTLLKIIMGEILADSGKRKIAPSVNVGYLEQNFDSLPQGSVHDILGRRFCLSTEEAAIELHKIGLAPYDAQIENYSIGQKRRLQLLFLKIQRCNVLLLDEPTNHIDLLTLEELEEAFLSFAGAIIAVTHDKRFINRIGSKIWSVEKSRHR